MKKRSKGVAVDGAAKELKKEGASIGATSFPSKSSLKGEFGLFGRKNRSTLSLVVIVLGLVFLLAQVISSFRETNSFELNVKDKIFLDVHISANQFVEGLSKNPCGGRGQISGLESSILYVTSTQWNQSVALGQGVLNDAGDCVYTPELKPGKDFGGGVINAYVQFPFGRSAVNRLDLGLSAPYNKVTLKISLGNA